MKYLLGTNVCIALINQRSTRVFHQLTARGVGQAGLSSITVSELAFGVAKTRSERNHLALQAFLLPFEIVDFDERAAWVYGDLRAALERSGTSVGALDMQIAAQALALDVTLVTHNTRELKRIPKLRVEDWH